ncbi:MAG: hypothetical protein EAZ30_08955 [Betaproteobacteria bacterium]|nr:MAG: hypothetical protein EAZ43_12850 [Betaproteobacteria bacterium]TAG47656.1 MAG: hypothetical protein EAZ30_08955 [Betaproteobacteria bacterium]
MCCFRGSLCFRLALEIVSAFGRSGFNCLTVHAQLGPASRPAYGVIVASRFGPTCGDDRLLPCNLSLIDRLEPLRVPTIVPPLA